MKEFFFILLLSVSLVTSVSAQITERQKFDEFIPADCEMVLSKLDSYALNLQNDPKSKGFIIFYDGAAVRYGKKYQPTHRESEYLIKSFENYLVKARDIPQHKIEIINGGFRRENFVELWIAPQSMVPPKSTPTLKKLTYKKRKFVQLCAKEIAPFIF